MENLGGSRSAEYVETIADGETGESVYVHPINNNSGLISCTLISNGNTGKIQTSTSTLSAITAGSATWVDWSEGDVTTTTIDVISGPVTGIRGVSVSGEISIEIVF
jgi:hypothetical protein